MAVLYKDIVKEMLDKHITIDKWVIAAKCVIHTYYSESSKKSDSIITASLPMDYSTEQIEAFFSKLSVDLDYDSHLASFTFWFNNESWLTYDLDYYGAGWVYHSKPEIPEELLQENEES